MGIILKAADDVKLLLSRSLCMIFKSIVSHLATKNKGDLSWYSIQSNSYHHGKGIKKLLLLRWKS